MATEPTRAEGAAKKMISAKKRAEILRRRAAGETIRVISQKVCAARETVRRVLGLIKPHQPPRERPIRFYRINRRYCHGCNAYVTLDPCPACLARGESKNREGDVRP